MAGSDEGKLLRRNSSKDKDRRLVRRSSSKKDKENGQKRREALKVKENVFFLNAVFMLFSKCGFSMQFSAILFFYLKPKLLLFCHFLSVNVGRYISFLLLGRFDHQVPKWRQMGDPTSPWGVLCAPSPPCNPSPPNKPRWLSSLSATRAYNALNWSTFA